jgi:hypothetical protein
VSTLALFIPCAASQTNTHRDANRFVKLASIYGQRDQPKGSISAEQPVELQRSVSSNGLDEEGYKYQVEGYLFQKDYEALERTAHEARSSQARFRGGTWQLFDFYDALKEPIVRDEPTGEDWRSHIASLKAWESAWPESVTARIALAFAYETYGSQARGTGYADSVSDMGWKLNAERDELAASTLTEAAKLKEKCPFWFEAMQGIAISQGWDKSRARKLLEQAVAFEPHYYHYYREYANFLLPKWYGEPGEAEAFAEQVSNQVGGSEGKFLYFEIASVVMCCDPDNSQLGNLSWPKVKEGYTALGQLYGYSNLKMNRFAYMSVEAHDTVAAQQAFAGIGDDWNHIVWCSRKCFENARLRATRATQ